MLWYVVRSEILFCICHCLSISSKKIKRLLSASPLTQGATTTSLVVSSLIWFYTGCLSWHNLKQHLSSNQTSIFFFPAKQTWQLQQKLVWPFSSDLSHQKCILPKEQLTRYFLLFRPISVNSRHGCVEKLPARLAPTAKVQSHLNSPSFVI